MAEITKDVLKAYERKTQLEPKKGWIWLWWKFIRRAISRKMGKNYRRRRKWSFWKSIDWIRNIYSYFWHFWIILLLYQGSLRFQFLWIASFLEVYENNLISNWYESMILLWFLLKFGICPNWIQVQNWAAALQALMMTEPKNKIDAPVWDVLVWK